PRPPLTPPKEGNKNTPPREANYSPPSEGSWVVSYRLSKRSNDYARFRANFVVILFVGRSPTLMMLGFQPIAANLAQNKFKHFTIKKHSTE
ncbi:MAG: hypothetical protein LBC74_09055, partial [Planctomycetaceae bacterium]|nr:hypothetical protein [Planctomycetaceae bacterium]